MYGKRPKNKGKMYGGTPKKQTQNVWAIPKN